VPIVLHLHDILKSKVKTFPNRIDGAFDYQLTAGASVGQLLQDLGLDHCYVGLVVVNGRQAAKDYCLQDGDRVELFSPMSGG
jgi:sulfur carrier protein ThiS